MTKITLSRAFVPAAFLALSSPAGAADPARAEGTIDLGGDVRVEVLSKKVPVGQRIDLPEGWYRVEEEGSEDGQVGSFTVASVGTTEAASGTGASAAPPAPPAPDSPAAFAATALSRSDSCRAERNAYLRELWHASGIEVDDPDALLRGLEAGDRGPAAGYFWFALSTDAFRNLAWSSDLRGRARDLARCVNERG